MAPYIAANCTGTLPLERSNSSKNVSKERLHYYIMMALRAAADSVAQDLDLAFDGQLLQRGVHSKALEVATSGSGHLHHSPTKSTLLCFV